MKLVPPALADVERVFRAEYGRAVAVLTRVFGDIDTAEDAVADAFAEAARRWPLGGLPPSPAGWIITTAGPDGTLVLLADQDRARWDRALITEGRALIRRCLRRDQPGPLPAPGRDQRRAQRRAHRGRDELEPDPATV